MNEATTGKDLSVPLNVSDIEFVSVEAKQEFEKWLEQEYQDFTDETYISEGTL